MGAVVIKADNMPPEFMSGSRSNGFSYAGRSATPRSGAHSGTSASNQRPGSRSAEDASSGRCENCTLNFTTTRKKHKCFQCHSLYCDNCLLNEADRTRDRRRCNRCRVFSLDPMQRSELRRLRVKDLRQFLTTKHIPSDMCTEKDELVELIMRHSANETTRRTAEEQRAQAETRRRAAEEATPGDNSNFSSSAFSSHTSTTYTSGTPGVGEQLTETLRRLQEEVQRHVFSEREDSEPSSATSNEEAPPSQPKRRTSLTDLSNADEVEDLTVRQLKELLSANFVDYKGCVEKEELVERVKRLYKSRQNIPTDTTEGEGMDGDSSVPEDTLCKICMDAAIDCVLLECGHMVTCTKCGRQMNECPICRQYVVRAVHVFKS
ncbi:E3 ubiquitin-protein ligase RNF34-like isoform X1 [Branchiostoma lanceolatum]|uniref:E3 ubiquitin-protein ligase RNF34-like isoform X1 n=1 Tax=Branchiostoma lanceolatum TaxID=7740 RepID=UPI003454D04A